jgi:hypothetical protein
MRPSCIADENEDENRNVERGASMGWQTNSTPYLYGDTCS